jgi:hypothetical protein
MDLEPIMGLMDIGQYFRKHTAHPFAAHSHHHDGLDPADDRHLDDVERIARALAHQGGAPADEWPFFTEAAESYMRLSAKYW